MDLFRALRIQHKDVVALVGGGGKTSAMFRLGGELAAQGWRVVVTASTRLGADQVGLAPHIIIQSPDQLTHQLLTHSPILLTGEIDSQLHKAAGLRPDVIDQLVPILGADAVINEADGARTLPFKAPGDHEPVITPATTLVVPVVGIDAVGRPLDAAYVHRPERIAELTGAEPGQPITPEMIATVLVHPRGGLKGIPSHARVVVLINKVYTEVEDERANRLANGLLDSPRVAAVAIGAVQEADPIRRVKSRVGVVVLAAGASRRFGRLKQLLPWGEGTLLTHAVDVALALQADVRQANSVNVPRPESLDLSTGQGFGTEAQSIRPVVVVLGCRADACRAALGDRPVKVVINPDWAKGQSTSVHAGLAALPENVDAVLFHLADQPGVTPAVMQALIARHATTLAPVVWPEYEGQRGNPVLFDCVAFPKFRELAGDVGAKPVLMDYARVGMVERVAVDERGVLFDVDVPSDLSPTQLPVW